MTHFAILISYEANHVLEHEERSFAVSTSRGLATSTGTDMPRWRYTCQLNRSDQDEGKTAL
jgi:hypothetical protein